MELRLFDRHGNCARVVYGAQLEAASMAGVKSEGLFTCFHRGVKEEKTEHVTAVRNDDVEVRLLLFFLSLMAGYKPTFKVKSAASAVFPQIGTQCEPGCLQTWSVKSDHILI